MEIIINIMLERKRELGITYANIARRSGLNVSTVRRCFQLKARWESILAVCGALGLTIRISFVKRTTKKLSRGGTGP